MSQGYGRMVRFGTIAAAVAGLFLLATTSQAANTWDGGATPNSNWSAPNNWDNNLVPTFPAQLTFGGAVNLSPNNDLGDQPVDGIVFDVVSGSFSIGGQAFTLGDPATADNRRAGITNNNALLQTISNNLTLSRGQHNIVTTATGGLTLSGSLTRNSDSGAYFAPLLGTSIKTTLANGPSGLIGGWAVVQNPAPTSDRDAAFFAKVDGSGNVIPYGFADYSAANDIDGDDVTPETMFPAGTTATSNIRWRGSSSAGANLTPAAPGITNLNTFLYDAPEGMVSRQVQIGGGNTLRFTNGGGVFRSNNTGTNGGTSGLEFNGAETAIFGDYNNDGNVDAADYVVWRNAGPTDTLPNDPTAGAVDISDYDTWKAAFGSTRLARITAGNSTAPAELVFWTNTQTGASAANPGDQHNRIIELINTVITDNPEGGPVTVVKNGPGAVRTSNTGGAVNGIPTSNAGHTFTGGLYVNRGVWRSDNVTNDTQVSGSGFGLGPVYVASGAQAYAQSDQTINNDFFIAGTGIDEGNFHVGAIRFNSDGVFFNGMLTLTSDARVGARGGQASNADFTNANLFDDGIYINGKVTGNHNLEWNVQTDQGSAGIDANMPTIILSNSANDWGGNTTIGRGRIRVGGTGEVIPHGPNAGDVILLGQQNAASPGAAASSPSILSLDSHTETVNGLLSAGTVVDPFDNQILAVVTNSTAGAATLRVGANNATSTFGGAIMDDTSVNGIVNVTKIGSGTFTLTGDANTWGGDTRVEGGKMVIAPAAGFSQLADAADIYVLTGAQLELNFSGTDFIDSLFLGGVQVAGGAEWGSAASGAANTSALLLGLGKLFVQTGPGSGAVAAVPEPGTFALLLVAGLLGTAVRRRARRVA